MNQIKFAARRLSYVAAATIALAALPLAAHASDWPQNHSDVPADPGILFGKLANGMRYAIMHNATPKEGVAIRLFIQSGSLEESDAQQGLAHFTEHMAFRGSRNIPESEVWPGLQRLGMTIGADANAQTGWTSTQYQFNLPRNDDATVDAGLLRLREIASELTLAQRAMDDERGVILSEERLRDTPAFHELKRVIGLALPDSLAGRRFPIGLTDVIKNAPISLIRAYYEAYYRPERAVVIVVGNIDPKAMEAKLAATFGSWKGVGPAGTTPSFPPPGPRGAEADLFVDPGTPSSVVLNWLAPMKPDTKAREAADLAKLVAFQILGYRLQDIAAGPQHPFAAAEIGHDLLAGVATFDSAQLTIRPADWRIALDAADTAVRRLEKFGVTEDEVRRAKDEFTANFQNAAAGAATRPSPQIADSIAQSIDENDVYGGPAGDLALITSIFKDMNAATVNAALRQALPDHGPLITVSSPIPVEGGKPAVVAALAASEKTPLTADTARASIVWPYSSFGPVGTVASQQAEPALDATFVRFANGVRLTVKPTKFSTSEVLIEVRVGNGRLGLSPTQDSPRWAIGRGYVQGGTKAIDYEDMRRVLAGKVYDIKARMGDDGLVLSGHTRTADLATQLQVLAAYVAAPGWRADAFERARTATIDELEKVSGSPNGVFSRDGAALLRGGDRRWMVPSAAEVAAAKPQQLQDMLAPALASGPIEIVMVGDISVADATQAVAATFGALPKRTDDAPPSREAATIHFPPPTASPIVLHHRGRADQGMAVAAWPTTDRFDRPAVAALRVLKGVIDARIMDQLRVQEGATYSPETDLSSSTIFPGYGYLLAATELPPAKMKLFFSVIASIAADLKAHPVSADELNRARKPLKDTIITDRQTNDFWSYALLDMQTNPRMLDIVRNTVADLDKVTASDVQRAAQAYLSDAKIWKLEITPQEPVPAPGH